jgi:hypothetical protein
MHLSRIALLFFPVLMSIFRYSRALPLRLAGTKRHLRLGRSHAQGSFSSTDLADQLMQRATRLWVERMVFGKGLCPWAPTVRMRVTTLHVRQLHDDMALLQLCDRILREARDVSDPGSGHQTTLLVLPEYASFDAFLELVDVVEVLLESEQMDEHVQVAHFHPEYQFDGEGHDSVENYTNRSPYPVLHLLRVCDVARGVQEYGGDTAPIWQKNKETMKALGLAAIKAINKQILEDAAQGSAADAEGQTD